MDLRFRPLLYGYLMFASFILVCDRLEAFERDENFSSGPDTEVGPVYHMDSPQLVSDEDISNNTDMQVVLHVYSTVIVT